MRATNGSSRKRPSRTRGMMKLLALCFLFMSSAAAGAAGYYFLHVQGRFFDQGVLPALMELPNRRNLVVDPARYFPGRNRITVLCVGLDRNIVVSKDPRINGMPTSKGARSDVLMVASLDLVNNQVAVLSIPRDTRVQLPGRRGHDKINAAHARGGIPYMIEAVEEFLGIDIDYHVVLKQEAIEQAVDAMGGLRVYVEKDMHYVDNWGGLFIDLKEGDQVLNGDQVVGYIRFRKDPEGDLGRIRRQQKVIQLLAEKGKSPALLSRALPLIDAVKKQVRTDLTPEQQLALAHLLHKMDAANVQTVSLPVAYTTMVDGLSYVVIDEEKKEAAVDWVVRGDRMAFNRLIRVELRNASGDPELYQRVYRCLSHYGFEVVRGGRAPEGTPATTHALQRDPLRGTARRIWEVLGIEAPIERVEARGANVTLYVGKDLASNRVLTAVDWPEPRVRTVRREPHRPAQERRPRRSEDATVTIEALPDEGLDFDDYTPEPPLYNDVVAPFDPPNEPGTYLEEESGAE